MAKKPKSGIEKALEDAVNPLARFKAEMATIRQPEITPMITPSNLNPAKWMYERLGNYIQDFESNLDNDHEIGGRLVSFGQEETFHIENVGFHGPDIISFDGTSAKGERVQLIQHITQLSVLLVAMPKLGEKPRRIGFIWDDADNDTES